MKNFLVVTFALIAFYSCTLTESVINATLTNTLDDGKEVVDTTYNNKMAYLYNSRDINVPLDSSVVVDGKFTLKFKPDSSILVYRIRVDDRAVSVLSDLAKMNVSIESIKKAPNNYNITGSALNDEFKKFKIAARTLESKFGALLDGVRKEYDSSDPTVYPEYKKAETVVMDKFKVAYDSLNLEFVNNNKDNELGIYVLSDWISVMPFDYSKFTLARTDSLLATVSERVRNYSTVVKSRSMLEAVELTSLGKMFADFSGTDAKGDSVKLSDYVGKGDYVLADFWASWCGPCIGEFPNIRAAHEKYLGKGLVVLGVNIKDKKDKFEKAVEAQNITWPQICNFDNDEAAEKYGVNAIPFIILFAPDGTIIEKGLRGGGIENKLAELIK
ncbi:MAG: TlpA disulfide reductase family protein [Rikenellaceae bacterium]